MTSRRMLLAACSECIEGCLRKRRSEISTDYGVEPFDMRKGSWIIPLVVLLVAAGLLFAIAGHWTEWEGHRAAQRTDDAYPHLLILRTTVQTYAPGSETRRAVTTVSGATKMNVRIQLLTPGGDQVLEHVVAGNVRFIGSNLRATHNLAHSVAATLKRSTLPEMAGIVLEQETGKVSAFQMAANR
jgi:hypothetical protein